MGKGKSTLAWAITMGLLLDIVTVGTADAAGPWKGRIADAETGKAIERVVVLAVWLSYAGSLGGWAGAQYFDSEEVVTGPDGRFVIPARRTFSLWFRAVKGPALTIFKPGYGQWRFQGSENWPSDVIERKARVEEAWKQFTGDGVVFELPPLKTREARLKFYQSPGRTPPAFVPRDRMRRWQEAEQMERAFLGFRN